MKKIVYIVAMFVLLILSKTSFACNNPYYATPPFVQANLPSNIMLVLDYSGSMSFFAYPGNTDSYDETKTYYGYFIPDKMYKCSEWSGYANDYNCSGYWYKDDDTTFNNSNYGTYKYDASNTSNYYGSNYYFTEEGEYSGNVLNWLTMKRIDILRWILTGGEVVGDSRCIDINSCNIYSNNQFSCTSNDLCGWKEYGECKDECSYLWPKWKCEKNSNCSWSFFRGCKNTNVNCSSLKDESECNNYNGCKWKNYYEYCYNEKSCSSLNESQCKNNQDLCEWKSPYVITSSGEKIKMQDVKSYKPQYDRVEGILQDIERKAEENDQKPPRIGAIMFDTNVFDTVALSDNYSNLIEKINTDTVDHGATATYTAVNLAKDMYDDDTYTINTYFDKVSPYTFNINGDNVTVPCAKNFVLLMSDGEWNTPDSGTNSDPIRPIDAMWKGGTADLVDLPGKQMVETYTVSMFANPNDNGTNALKWMAVYGNYYDNDNRSGPYNLSDNSSISKVGIYPNTSLTQTEYLEKIPGNPEVKENYNNTGPYGFYEGDDPEALKNSITSAFNEILKQVSSGTAASVLSEKERVNTGIIQAAFYPKKTFASGTSSNTVDWVGSLYDWWFYSSYSFNGYISNIREDTITNKDLDICTNGQPGGDYIIDYSFEDNKVKIKGYKSTCNGQKESSTADVTYDGLEDAHFVWSAGKVLSETTPADRTIYTYVGNLKPNSEENLESLKDIDNTPTQKLSELFGDDDGNGIIDDASEPYAYAKKISFSDLKNYIYGEDIDSYRSRNIGDNETWKLGDIIYSTPKIVNYDNYSVAFVGANDGMLHAFLVGKYRFDNLGVYQLSKLRNSSFSNDTNDLGKELWAFIPKNVLPYLRFLADPDYCHMYFVDLTPYIIEIKDRWGNIEKRILIGGMRLGGAVGSDNSTVSVNPPKDTCPTPSNYNSSNDPSTPTKGCLGLSSYFALDITNPTKPKFLWEFTDPKLGFSYSGPAFITTKDSSGQKHYYVMFTSGPTDYKGDVGQNLTTFILTLNSSDLTIENVSTKDLSSSLGLGYAFGGRLFTNGIDKDNNGTTDLLFEGVVQYDNGDWKGNVIGIRPDDANPDNWDFFKLFNSSIGPVVSPVSYEKCFNKNFIYFGSGRYFFKDDTPSGTREKLYGIEIDNCFNENCSITNLVSSSSTCSNIGSNGYGWYQDLLTAGGGYNKERDITTPTTTKENVIYFTTTQPTSDICGFGGRSRLWGLNCATGESLGTQGCSNYITGSIVGTLLLQTSVGEISKFDVNITPNAAGGNNPFTQEGGKATEWKTGTSSPNPSNYIPPTIKQPAEILYEIEN